jgi:hypothetical protein
MSRSPSVFPESGKAYLLHDTSYGEMTFADRDSLLKHTGVGLKWSFFNYQKQEKGMTVFQAWRRGGK